MLNIIEIELQKLRPDGRINSLLATLPRLVFVAFFFAPSAFAATIDTSRN